MAMAMATATSSTTSSSLSSFTGTSLQVDVGAARVTCRKADIHPTFYKQAKVFCNGELVLTTGGTQAEYVVDVWSGNHPFYQGKDSTLLQDAGRVDKFAKRFGQTALSNVPILNKGEIVFEKKKKNKGKGKK